MDAVACTERERPKRRSRASPASCGPFARLVKPAPGEELSRINQSLVHAGYRTENAVEILLGVKLLLPLVIIIVLWQIDSHLEKPLELPPAIAVAFIAIAVRVLPAQHVAGQQDPAAAAGDRGRAARLDGPAGDLRRGRPVAGRGDGARGGRSWSWSRPILAVEMKQTLLEIQAGVRRSDAFHRLSTRTGVEDLRTLSAMIIQTEMFGTSVSRALRVHAEGMRTKRMQRAEEKAAMVSVKMTVPLIMCILPSLFAVVLGPAIATISKRMAGM